MKKNKTIKKICGVLILILALSVMIGGPLLFKSDLVIEYMTFSRKYISDTWQFYIVGLVFTVIGYMISSD
jgi:hypothetical protein